LDNLLGDIVGGMHVAKFVIVGGGHQQVAIAEALFLQGHDVALFGFARYERPLAMQCKHLAHVLADADLILGPTPCAQTTACAPDNAYLNAPYHDIPVCIEDILTQMYEGQVFIAGEVDAATVALAHACGVHIVDITK